ncbi:beta-ketoacyl reductase [Aspergillus homomorphus CBS 101889]|uniref:Carrier domain-containing protein n=1 Tax=Aspergillus homomorphus (strain CBS 101889) TaxID=1450537 RepID=A0A395HVD6_ASPHC|nr:hypothetical protein BO97DRAFT_425059 [Aspergillus homomorphus CBS 101889]RAL11760.1 hypothetical protein BO97DRAFT_425059 [Aspergillus homomorphus CBS 101889]
MTWDDWKQCVEPKIGQANYATANTFLDAFVRYRHHLGLPASVLDIGGIREVCRAAEHPELLDGFRASGMHIMQVRDLLGAMTLAIRRARPIPEALPAKRSQQTQSSYINRSQISLRVNTSIPMESLQCRVTWKHDRRMAVYHNLHEGAGATNAAASRTPLDNKQSSLKTFIDAASRTPRLLQPGTGAHGDSTPDAVGTIARGLGAALAEILVKDPATIDVASAPAKIGLNSLVAMELRDWIRHNCRGVEVSVLTISRCTSLLALAETVRQELVDKLGSSTFHIVPQTMSLIVNAALYTGLAYAGNDVDRW